jgi:hypothetical protein
MDIKPNFQIQSTPPAVISENVRETEEENIVSQDQVTITGQSKRKPTGNTVEKFYDKNRVYYKAKIDTKNLYEENGEDRKHIGEVFYIDVNQNRQLDSSSKYTNTSIAASFLFGMQKESEFQDPVIGVRATHSNKYGEPVSFNWGDWKGNYQVMRQYGIENKTQVLTKDHIGEVSIGDYKNNGPFKSLGKNGIYHKPENHTVENERTLSDLAREIAPDYVKNPQWAINIITDEFLVFEQGK